MEHIPGEDRGQGALIPVLLDELVDETSSGNAPALGFVPDVQAEFSGLARLGSDMVVLTTLHASFLAAL